MVAGLELGALGQEELLARPHVRGAGDFQHALTQGLGAGDGAAFHQVGDHRQVGARLAGAFLHRAHALTDLQADVPQQGEEALDRSAQAFVLRAVEQDQDVDVGVWVQLAAAVAADRDQGDGVAVAPVEARPGLAEDLVDEPGAVGDQAADVAAEGKAPVERLGSLADCFLEGGDRAALQGQFGLELAAVEQLVIHFHRRHRAISIQRGWGGRLRAGSGRWCRRCAG
ncbi:hypothetical protein D9M71_490640 [compost metagenome]